MCIPRKGDFIVLTEDIISTVGSQKLEFYSKKCDRRLNIDRNFQTASVNCQTVLVWRML